MKSLNNYKKKREQMVEGQLKRRGLKGEKLLEAFREVPRHKFVPDRYKSDAYKDHPLPIGKNQTISQPFIVAQMSKLLDISPGDKVLEIGTGSGYQAAILDYMGAEVYGVERIGKLKDSAEKNLRKAGCEGVKIKEGDGTKGWPEFSPYRGILVTAAAPEVPEPLVKQLEVTGKLVIPEGGKFLQDLKVYTKVEEDKLETANYGGCRFVPLIGEFGWNE
ncbi:MAG: protein-L-isoaspartate(D-aspartate) O-methyltransferase [Elusimicrobiota bacterium]